MRNVAFFLFALILFGCIGDNDTPGDSGHSTSPVASYSSSDTLIVMQEAKISSDPDRPEWIHDLEAGDTVRVVGKENIEGETSLRVHHNGVKGWMGENYDFSRPDYYRSLRENGFDLVVLSQIFSKNEGNEINLHNYVSNISKSEDIEAIHFTWELFDKDGNPASTDKHSGNIIKVTAEGDYLPLVETPKRKRFLLRQATTNHKPKKGTSYEHAIYIDRHGKSI
jgi:hypothetical protein